MPFRYRLKSGGHADKNAKIVDRRTGKLVDLPAGGASAGDIVVYEEEPDFIKTDRRFEKVDDSAKPPAPVTPVTPEETPTEETTPGPEPTPTPEADTDTDADAEESVETDLNSMTVEQLKAYAEENEIDLNGAKTKADIIKRISGENGGSTPPSPEVDL
jgi:hypothetical protein